MARVRKAGVAFGTLLLGAAAAFFAGCSSGLAPESCSAGCLKVLMTLPPPPPDDSAEHQAELELVLQAQRGAGPEDLSRARSEFHLDLDAFRQVLGPWCSEKNLPATRRLLKKAAAEADPLADELKAHYRRARPPAGNPAIQPLDLPHFDHESYPSWHATRGFMYAEILAELLPARREELLRRGQEIGWDRVIAGMHHPSDITAGRVLAHLVVQDLMRGGEFMRLLKEARNEIEAVSGGLRPAAGEGPADLKAAQPAEKD